MNNELNRIFVKCLFYCVSDACACLNFLIFSLALIWSLHRSDSLNVVINSIINVKKTHQANTLMVNR